MHTVPDPEMDENSQHRALPAPASTSAPTTSETGGTPPKLANPVVSSASEEVSSKPDYKHQRRSRAASVITPNACKECRKKRAKVSPRRSARILHYLSFAFEHSYLRYSTIRVNMSLPLSAMGKYHVAGANPEETSGAFTRPRYANPRRVCARKSTICSRSKSTRTCYYLLCVTLIPETRLLGDCMLDNPPKASVNGSTAPGSARHQWMPRK